MNKHYMSLTLAVGLLGLSACQGTTKQSGTASESNQEVLLSDGRPIVLDTLQDKAIIKLGTGEQAPVMDYSIKYIYPKGNKTLLQHYNSAILGASFAQVEPQKLLKAYRDKVTQDYQSDDAFASGEWMHSLEVDQLLITEQFLSVSWLWADYSGGAHGSNARGCASFDLKTGQQITESDIFRADFKEELGKVIQSAIMRAYKVSRVEDLEEQGFFSAKEIMPNGTFMLTKEGIYYCFQPYEIASYANGIIEVSLTWDEIAPFIKPNSIIEHYI